jgi:predicted YcjX-like family ATPase
MAIISDYEEDQTDTKPLPSSSRTPPKTSTFTATFDPQNPMRIVEGVLDFLGKESDFLEKETAEKEIFAVVKKAVEEAKRKKAAEEAKVKAAEEAEVKAAEEAEVKAQSKRLKVEKEKEKKEKMDENENKEESAKGK